MFCRRFPKRRRASPRMNNSLIYVIAGKRTATGHPQSSALAGIGVYGMNLLVWIGREVRPERLEKSWRKAPTSRWVIDEHRKDRKGYFRLVHSMRVIWQESTKMGLSTSSTGRGFPESPRKESQLPTDRRCALELDEFSRCR